MTKGVWGIVLAATVTLALVGGALPVAADPGSALGRYIELEDLFAQQTMAESAKAMTLIAWIQIVIGSVTLLGLAWTLKYTRDTAKAGQASADAAEKALNAVERPYIFLSGVQRIKYESTLWEPNYDIDYTIANYGKTPALIGSALSSISFNTEVAEPVQVDSQHTTKHSPVFASNETRLVSYRCSPNDIELQQRSIPNGAAIYPGPKTGNLFFRLLIHYSGPFTSEHETSACWAWDEKENCLITYGGEKYNYTR